MSKKYRKNNNLYNATIITKKINIPMKNITSIINNTQDLNKYMEEVIEKEISDKCIVEGYIKPNSIQVLSHSNGIQENQNIKFQVVFECLVCNPSEGQIINCIAKNITKAGIRAEVEDTYNPLIIFVARDHNYLNKLFSTIKNEQKIYVRVIGSRFELNDSKISIVGEIVRASKLAKLFVGETIDDEIVDQLDDEVNQLDDELEELDELDALDNLDDDVDQLEDDIAELELDDAEEDANDEAEEAEEAGEEAEEAEEVEGEAEEAEGEVEGEVEGEAEGESEAEAADAEAETEPETEPETEEEIVEK
jgi:DNA-directed RNA polymerase subunit E'/Rpb7